VDHAGDYAARLPPELRRTLDGIGKLDEFQRLDWMVRFLGQIRPFVNLKKFLRAHAADQGWRVAHNGPWQMTCTTPSGHRLVVRFALLGDLASICSIRNTRTDAQRLPVGSVPGPSTDYRGKDCRDGSGQL
jgi:hypothetical protein